jgi:hypothetical protein
MIEDLGSRNGVVVNGQKVDKRARVEPGDKILIGSQELAVIEALTDSSGAPGSNSATRRLATLDVPWGDSSLSGKGDDEAEITTMMARAANADEDVSFVRRMDAFRVLGSIADKALALGRAEDAERVLAASLHEVLQASRGGKAIQPALAEQSARFAAKLATATGKSSWVDFVIEIFDRLERPAPAAVIDELYAAFRKVAGVDVPRVKAYVAKLRDRLPTFGPAECFLVQRIEGLERLATLR